uniref:Bacteriophage/plasmid primase P4 C-terminal domain-containing protein n=1 Tax=Tolypothrix bouteillei VB521301 TaxID=1479485 RepID=A0A0C1QLE4_9CYAN
MTLFTQQRTQVIEALMVLGLSPLPVAPAQDPQRYPKKNKQGEIEYQEDGNPKPLFTGKNPSYLDQSGIPRLVNHSNYQNRQPSKVELDLWFSNPSTGVGCLGTDNFCWIDLDSKQFPSQEECDRAFNRLVEGSPQLYDAWLEKTQSGGYRIGVELSKPANFTNFKLSEEGNHVGEALKAGRFTVLAPTVGAKGSYQNLNRPQEIPVIESLESVGIYPVKAKSKSQESSLQKLKGWASQPIKTSQTTIATDEPTATVIVTVEPGTTFEAIKEAAVSQKVEGIFLIDFISQNSREILKGDNKGKDKSAAFTTALNDLYGCANWLSENNIPSYGNTEELAYLGGRNLGIEVDKIDRIIASIDQVAAQPSTKYAGGDKACWEKVKKLAKPIYNKIFGESKDEKPNTEDTYYVKTTAEDTILKNLFENGEGNFIVMNQAFYQYSDKGNWNFIKDNAIEKKIAHKLRDFYAVAKQGDGYVKLYKYATENNKKNSFKFCRSALTLESEPYNDHLLCFNNCTVDLRTGEIQGHDKKNFLISKIAADYFPNSECPEVFRDFIVKAYGEELLPLIRAITSMLLDPTAPYGYFPHLIGASGSGKGTLLRFWTSMFGLENVRSISGFSDLKTPEQRHQNLTGSKIIAFPDLGGYQSGLRSFYELVDNGSLSGRALFSSSSYEKRWNCRFIVASVDYLQVENSGDGWDRRCIPLPTKQRFGQPDPNLGNKLQECKAQVISWALSMPREERDNLIINSESLFKKIKAQKEEQSLYSDSIKSFVDQCLLPSELETATLKNSDLYDCYAVFCKANGFGLQSSTKFVAHLRQVLPFNHTPRSCSKIKGAVIWTPAQFKNLQFRPGAFTKVDSSMGGSPIWACDKTKLDEGGLNLIKEFWNPSQESVVEPISEVEQILEIVNRAILETQPNLKIESLAKEEKWAIRLEKAVEVLELPQAADLYSYVHSEINDAVDTVWSKLTTKAQQQYLNYFQPKSETSETTNEEPPIEKILEQANKTQSPKDLLTLLRKAANQEKAGEFLYAIGNRLRNEVLALVHPEIQKFYLSELNTFLEDV